MRKIIFIAIVSFMMFFSGCKTTTILEVDLHDNSYTSDEYAKSIVYKVLKSQLTLHDNSLSTYSSGKVKKYSYEDRYENTLYLEVSSDYLKIYDYETQILRDTTLDFFMDLDTLYYEYNYDGQIYTQNIGNIYFQTLSTFAGKANNNPYSGKMKITKSKMSFYLNVVNEVDVDIALDYDSDGLHDRVIYTTWSELGF